MNLEPFTPTEQQRELAHQASHIWERRKPGVPFVSFVPRLSDRVFMLEPRILPNAVINEGRVRAGPVYRHRAPTIPLEQDTIEIEFDGDKFWVTEFCWFLRENVAERRTGGQNE